MTEPSRYRYAMISNEVRRDLQAPLRWFQRLDVYHFYRVAPWNDMKAHDFTDKLIRFVLPLDLLLKLWRTRPDIIQGPEPFSILMLPYLCVTLLYLWLHPRGSSWTVRAAAASEGRLEGWPRQ